MLSFSWNLCINNSGENEAYVSIGISKDTAEFAIEAIRRWWAELGTTRYRHPQRLLITADCGGSNGYRSRLWKLKLQELANGRVLCHESIRRVVKALGMIIEICHYPPGTSKWNKIEHRLFCHITRNWRGVPLESHEVVVNLGQLNTHQQRARSSLLARRSRLQNWTQSN